MFPAPLSCDLMISFMKLVKASLDGINGTLLPDQPSGPGVSNKNHGEFVMSSLDQSSHQLETDS